MSGAEPHMSHEDSISSHDPVNSKSKKAKDRRPANTAFRQQRLKAWQPILTPKTVLPLFFAIGVVFAPIGGLLLWASAQVNEMVFDYTDCSTNAPLASTTDGSGGPVPAGTVHWNFQSSHTDTTAEWQRTPNATYTYSNGVTTTTSTLCTIFFEIPEEMKPPVLFYYRLTNFYQNHRRYVKSFDSDQLKGVAVSGSTINGSSCDPLTYDPVTFLPYYPCGLIANSMFNDTFSSPVLQNTAGTGAVSATYTMTNNSGISWESDKGLYGKTSYTNYNKTISPPPNWAARFPGGYSDAHPPPDLSQDEGFQVWMRTAGLPTFSKLAQRNDTLAMATGHYRVDIYDNFNVKEYGGTKSIIISTRTVMGGKNPFLGIAYVVVGGICVLLGTMFTVTHLIKPRKLGDHTYLSWNTDQPTTGTASGREVR